MVFGMYPHDDDVYCDDCVCTLCLKGILENYFAFDRQVKFEQNQSLNNLFIPSIYSLRFASIVKA